MWHKSDSSATVWSPDGVKVTGCEGGGAIGGDYTREPAPDPSGVRQK